MEAMPAKDLDLPRILEWVAERPEREAEWLDLLSQLEYIGCRKILKAVPYTRVDAEVLQHVYEEAFHAYLLKQLASRRGRDGATWQRSRLSELGWRYFQTLDKEVSALQPDRASYPAVSWAIERRVLGVYPEYREITRDPQVRDALTKVLAQEKRHGKQFDADAERIPEAIRREAAAIEERLWSEFKAGLQDPHWVPASSPAPGLSPELTH